MMEGNKQVLLVRLLLVLFLVLFSYLLSSSDIAAHPLSRSLKMVDNDDQGSFAQQFAEDQQSLMEEEEDTNYMIREMLLEVENTGDYRPGANTHHDPPPPKR